MSIQPTLWQPLLGSHPIGRGAVICEHTLTSTNTVLKEQARQGAPHGSVCLCEMQTAGRGRLDRSWSSPEGCGVWMSVLLRPDMPVERAPLVTFCAALAMTRAVEETAGLAPRIKWPNDVVLAGRKVCGVLLEMGFDLQGKMFIIAGMGLNVRRGAYPPELRERAVALEECCTPPPRHALIASCLNHLHQSLSALEQGGLAAIAEDYRRLSCTLGQTVQVLSPAETFTGAALDVDEEGALLVRRESGETQRVLAGDVSVRGVMGYV